MNYRRLGSSGLRISEIGLGSHQTFGTALDLERSRAVIRRALELGINYFDTADGYGGGEAERVLGSVLAEFNREDWVIGTKCFFPMSDAPTNRGLSRKHLFESVDRSLRRLGVDHLDLMQCHRFDSETPLDETVLAFEDLARQGKILHWGLGRCSAKQIGDVVRTCAARGVRPPIAHQTLYNMLQREIEPLVLPASRRHGIGTLAYAPLAQGVLTGKYLGGTLPGGLPRGAARSAGGYVRSASGSVVAGGAAGRCRRRPAALVRDACAGVVPARDGYRLRHRRRHLGEPAGREHKGLRMPVGFGGRGTYRLHPVGRIRGGRAGRRLMRSANAGARVGIFR